MDLACLKLQAVHDVISFNSIQFYFVFVFTYKCKNHLPLQLVLELIEVRVEVGATVSVMLNSKRKDRLVNS